MSHGCNLQSLATVKECFIYSFVVSIGAKTSAAINFENLHSAKISIIRLCFHILLMEVIETNLLSTKL